MITIWHYIGAVVVIAIIFMIERFIRGFPHRHDPEPLTPEKHSELFN